MGKLIIFSAPSGSGKSTIVNYLLEQNLNIEFSISATSRDPRGVEQHGREYYFLSVEEFKNRIEADEFLEYEEVYPNKFYGTLKSEVQRIVDKGGNVIFDIDVVGGRNMKQYFGANALAVFVEPPSIDELKNRLIKRGTDLPEVIEQRICKAEYELTFKKDFDLVILNDNLEKAKKEALDAVLKFIEA